jgi:flagellin
MSVINTNVKSLVAQNSLTVNGRAMSKTMEQLSTGKRINSAADDAAGLAISTKMTAQVRGLNQAVRNANDAVSLLQTAEGATVEMTNMVQRMRELAVQSATDTNTTSDREYLNLEYQQLMKEITRIGANTQFNGMNILNNSAGFGTGGTLASPTTAGTEIRNVVFHVGANEDQTISATFKNFTFPEGSPPQKNTAVLNFNGIDMTGAKSLGIKIGDEAFSATIGTAIVGEALTGAEATAVATALKAEINKTVGFESVDVRAVGSSFEIIDPNGRAITLPTAADADAAAIAIAGTALTGEVAARTATAAAAPAANSVFSGDAKINDTDILTADASNTAIEKLDGALDNLNKERATFGSIINRLNYAADNLTNVSQNASASRSRVMDTDYAQATTELARTQIIQQAATAMLAQANQQPSSVLSLLQ